MRKAMSIAVKQCGDVWLGNPLPSEKANECGLYAKHISIVGYERLLVPRIVAAISLIPRES